MVADDDWRLQGQENWLQGVVLDRRTWRRRKPTWDHDHCDFCYVTITDLQIPDVLHEGYCTPDEHNWICPACFEDFRERFAWTLSTDPGTARRGGQPGMG